MNATTFEGRTVVVVSASWPVASSWVPPDQGRNIHIGAACARAFAQYGAQVVVLDPDASALDSLAKEQLGGLTRAARLLQADCCDLDALTQVARQIDGPVHALINCHSLPNPGTLEDVDAASIAEAVRWDLLGPLMASKAFLPHLTAARGAAIVNVGSIDGLLGNPSIPLYSMNKGGLIALTRVMANEFAPKGIRTNYIARGMTAERDAPKFAAYAALVAQTPLGRPAYPEEVADAACFLSSSHASYINGAVLPVDGGRTVITPGTRQPLAKP